jgi:hypothetical protein
MRKKYMGSHGEIMTISDWLMILAVLLAPLIAVQVQKWLEHYREDHERKLNVFKSLMATRAAAVSPVHVQALNMIDLEFDEKKYKNVRLAWKTYLDHLGNYPNDDEKTQPVWLDKMADLLAKLLQEMGKSLGYEFDEVHIKKGIYSPVAHGNIEKENNLLRRGLLRLLYGDATLKMDVQSLPIGEEEAKEQRDIRKGIKDLLDGNKELPVVLKESGGA